MKNNMMNMTAAAALVLGMASAAHAAPPADANINITAAVTNQTCDVNLTGASTVLDIGQVLKTAVDALTAGDFTNVDKGLNPSTTVSFTGCSSNNLPASAKLVFSAARAADATPAQTDQAWGDAGQSVGYGFGIEVTPASTVAGQAGAAGKVSYNHDSIQLDATGATSTDMTKMTAKIEPFLMKTGTVVAGTSLNVPVVISYTHS